MVERVRDAFRLAAAEAVEGGEGRVEVGVATDGVAVEGPALVVLSLFLG